VSTAEDQYKTLRRYFSLAMGIVAITAGALRSYNEFTNIIAHDVVHGLLAILLLITTIGWLIGWYYFDDKELAFLEKNIKYELPQTHGTTRYVQIVFLAILWGALINMTVKVEIYIALAIFTFFIASSGYHVVRRSLEPTYTKGYKTKKKGVIEFYRYYFNKPFCVLDNAVIIFLFIGLLFFMQYESTNASIFLYGSHIITILSILIHEVILWRWRTNRDKRMDSMQ